jgi:hypothetical protein
MQSNLVLRTVRVLLTAALVLVAALAQATNGITISRDQESLVLPGMSTTEVQRAIGLPDAIAPHRVDPGTIWTYEVAGEEFPVILFDVDFGSDGKVAKVGERVEDESD